MNSFATIDPGLSQLISLPSQEAHLWVARTDQLCCTPKALQSYRGYLSAEEIQDEERFADEKLHKNYVIARAFCRVVLSKYAPISPKDWKFITNDYGKPEIGNNYPGPPVYFNLSHCEGMIVCLVGSSREIGVDVECLNKTSISYLELARRFFSKAESERLEETSSKLQKELFFKFWTLKESYVKARGLGLALPLSEFSFCLAEDEIEISFSPEICDKPEDWQFELLQPTPRHLIAIAIRKGDSPPKQILAKQFLIENLT